MARLCCLFAVLVASIPLHLAANTYHCPDSHFDETHLDVKSVVDGDTLHLADGRKVRLIGINTPEINHKGDASEPYARKAQKTLKTLIGPKKQVHLQFDEQRQDHYGRLLAHVYNIDGKNLNQAQLAEGLATVLIVPPNIRWIPNCYTVTEQKANSQRLNIWQLPKYQPTSAAGLTTGELGYRLVIGKVTEVKPTTKGASVTIDGRLTLLIEGTSTKYFTGKQLVGYLDQTIQVRGWLKHGQQGFYMRPKHPLQITTISSL